MGAKTRITVSLDADLVVTLDSVSHKTGKPRSRLIEEALRVWRRHQLDEALREGYEAMAKPDRANAERRLSAGREALDR